MQSQWDELIGVLDPVPVPLSHAWLSSWLNAFAAREQMEFRCVFHNERLVGVAPLLRGRESYRGIPVTLLKLAANGHSPYSMVVVHPQLSADQKRRALELLTRVEPNEVGLFFKIPRHSELRAFLLDQSGLGHEYVGEKPSLLTPVIPINGDWQAFFGARPKKLKRSLRHKLNRYHADGGFQVDQEVITSSDQPVIDELVTISANSWKAGIGNDLKSNDRSRQFLLRLTETFGNSGRLSAWIMRRAGQPVAFELHLADGGVVYPIRADYDQSFKAFSPGSVLEYTVLKHLFDSQSARQYYTCADDYWYLSNWTSEYAEFCTIEVFGSSAALRALYYLEYRVIPVVKRLLGKKPRTHRAA
ncbi:GNAT family N-acetyltransferase [Marinobacter lipolyticus]|uniref:GNAT family N-acetyltransferase n=1 Tax=Marinobacter lipolyticus TaxID=209639 RepID=UPI001BCE0E2A|nr:GNAT family N-acetyltransferase [Marinobacter lipolyticus]MBS8238981.1 GNAT family N-acetyltransferase [Marinobacter lipolyticus]